MPDDRIHGFRVIGSVLTGRRDGPKEARIVLVDRGEGYQRFVVGFHWTGDEGWSDGYYTDSFAAALNDFWLRIVREVPVRPK